MNTQTPWQIASPGEWIRIFAIRYAIRRPELTAEEVVARAIGEFPRCSELSPEDAAERPTPQGKWTAPVTALPDRQSRPETV